jgi:hypothetical protein
VGSKRRTLPITVKMPSKNSHRGGSERTTYTVGDLSRLPASAADVKDPSGVLNGEKFDTVKSKRITSAVNEARAGRWRD